MRPKRGYHTSSILLVLIFGLCIPVVYADVSPDSANAINPTPLIITRNFIELSTTNSSVNSVQRHQEMTNISVVSVPEFDPRISFIVDSKTGREFVSDEVIVRYNYTKIKNPFVMKITSDDQNAKIGGLVTEDFSDKGLPGMQVLKLPKNFSVDEAVTEYEKNPYVLYAQPNYIYHVDAVTPNDPSFMDQWGLHNYGQRVNGITGTAGADINAPDAWNVTTGSTSVVVAVVDTGVLYTHSDLSSNIWTNPGEIPGNSVDDDHNGYIDDILGWNFVKNTSDPIDDNGHGSHVSGIIGAEGNNSIGVTGVNWRVRMMPLKAFDSSGSGSTTDAVLAILYANANGASVISNSWSGSGDDPSLKAAIDASNAVVVCAAGNIDQHPEPNNDLVPQYPASFSSANSISVAATDQNDNLAIFSHYGPVSVDLAAPGDNILSTGNVTGTYVYMQGTSMATPFVSGVAALIKSVNPRLTNIQVKDIILNNTDVLPSLAGKVNTSGRLNASKAVLAAYSTLTSITNISGKIGIFRNGYWYVDWNGNYAWDSVDAQHIGYFGANPGDQPVVGDWDGTGIGKIGIFRNGNWYVDWNGNGVWDATDATHIWTFGGLLGDIPVTGTWDGIGVGKAGVYRNGNWYVDWNGNGVWDATDATHIGFFGGLPGDIPVTGDWDGSGTSKAGIYRNGNWYVDWNGNGAWDATDATHIGFFGGLPGDVPITGDWDSSSISKAGIYRNGNWYVDWNGNGAWDATDALNIKGPFGIAGDIPVTGKW